MTETETRKTKLSDSFGGTVEKDIPENAEWIDDPSISRRLDSVSIHPF